MARDFNGSTGYLENAAALVTTQPLTLAGWYNTDAAATAQTVLAIDTNAGSARWQILLQSTGAVGAQSTSTANASVTSSGGSYSTGTWEHIAGVFTSDTSRLVYLNGTAGTANTTSRAVTGIDRTHIGVRYGGGTLASYFNGLLAELGIWNVALDAVEIAMLAKGVSPLFVRPASLVSYVPIYGRNSPEIDFKNAGTLSLSGTANQAAHPRIIMPAARRTIYVPTAGAGGPTGTQSNRLFSNRLNRTSRIAA